MYQLTKVIKPNKSLILEPTFSEYELASRAAGAEVHNILLAESGDFELTETVLAELITRLADMDILFLCNPNNPTGKIIAREKLNKILREASQTDTFVVIDEAFIDFLDNHQDITVIKAINSLDNILILRSLTKIYGIPGLRLGYALTNKEVVKNIENSRDPWSVNYFAQLACQQIFSQTKNADIYLKRTLERLNQEKEFLYNSLNKLEGIKVYYPTANYIFIKIKDAGLTSEELTDTLAKDGVMIRDCNNYTGLNDNYIRIAVKSRKANKILLDKLAKIL